ncbi:uncharacterized protein P174DRAFT_265649, partial [Aspergillus novofumigatus IBT 16806]
PSSGQTDFRVEGCQEKRELFPGPRRRLRVQLRCRGESTSGAGMLTGFPFGTRRTRAPFKRNFLCLRID